MSLHVVAFPARANPTDLSIFRKNVPFEKRREVGGRANAPRSKNWSIDERRGEGEGRFNYTALSFCPTIRWAYHRFRTRYRATSYVT